ncbi:pyridoxamine 5'-phosphate oxidase family protein [bacterium]|nr:pyridoxamine 5'-phosphate oxidase family protein [bacterium]MBU1993832.1 pyridoxamine 5'-phosphate oxidase family protein [bacterium]
MGKQYKSLTSADGEFIKKQKLFYLASCSGKEVNLSPKGYDTLRVLDENTLVFLNYPGSGNRSYADAQAEGEFTLVFNAYEGKAKILRLFCKATVIENKSENFYEYLELFKENENLVRDIFVFHIYAVESSCGESVPFMEYKGERNALKEWVVKMDASNKLEEYKKNHLVPPSLKNLK